MFIGYAIYNADDQTITVAEAGTHETVAVCRHVDDATVALAEGGYQPASQWGALVRPDGQAVDYLAIVDVTAQDARGGVG
jgi:hypothetical protein